MSDEKKRTEGSPPSGPSRAATLLLIGAVLGAAVVLFAWMNTESVPLTVFLWEPEVPKALLMFVPLLVGFVLGWGMAAFRRRPGAGGAKAGRREEKGDRNRRGP